MQGTTDTVDSGLVDEVIKPGYSAAQPGDRLTYVGVGSGKALDNARAGLADVVLTHAPKLEKKFVKAGYSYEAAGQPVFFSDYVIVGPKTDPAGVAAAAPHDAAKAFSLIAAAGKAGKASFVARGDNSGTANKESDIWVLARIRPSGSWYRTTNKGQAANLLDASACNPSLYPGGGCYTILDRGTYSRQVANGIVTNMRIVSQANANAAPGGRDLLMNQFSVYIVNPAKVTGVDVAGAKRFVAYLTSPGFRKQLGSFPTAADPAFTAGSFGGG